MHSASVPAAGPLRTAAAVLALVRWPNALIAAAGVLVGAWWATSLPPSAPVRWAALCAISLAACTNADNDWHDREIDRIAHPGRPLPAGLLAPATARAVSAVAAVAALLSAAAVGAPLLVATAGVLGLMALYSRRLKRVGVPGNVLVAVLASCPFLYGAWAAGRPLAALPLLAVGIPLHLAREIAKDLDDADGDAASRRTLPVAHGAGVARAALLGAVLLFVAALVPFAAGRTSLLVALLPALAAVVVAVRRALAGGQGSPLLFKAAMLLAMAALLVAGRR